jgi:hypothetical protein
MQYLYYTFAAVVGAVIFFVILGLGVHEVGVIYTDPDLHQKFLCIPM